MPPNRPRNDHAGIGPADTHHDVSILRERRDTWEASLRVLTVTHVAHPLAEELSRIGVKRTGLAENLGIGSPAESFITLRTVRRNGKIIRELPPVDVLYEPVHAIVSRFKRPGFQLLFHRRYGNGCYAFNFDSVCRRNGKIPVAKKCEARHILLHPFTGESIGNAHTVFRDAKIRPIDASRRSIAPPHALVGVIEHFSGQSRQHRTALCTKAKLRHGCAVLPEIHNKCLAFIKRKRTPRHCEIAPENDFCTSRRKDFTAKLIIDFRFFNKALPPKRVTFTCVILLAVKYRRMFDGSGCPAKPVIRIRCQD